ncbi:DHA2 family efflux MFS transporter permease subunit [Lacisediminimonas sp.]|uniref:DHA2 family efflux MFS transporter permease subunit n=1 Tax=Lacisediminimonas sp. TaxID=3060582 RepID=UPI002717FEB5|nr:DHA2 family efflux MFS transporter permease subunit [Lacisediminimonas sp.]MDO8300673.1 DHA2 family efflux MFS transporter permease subunit [Lacisediminimonas sp.]
MSQTIEELRERYGPRYRWRVLFSLMIGSMAAILASTIVNVAVPDLSAHFGLGQERAQWVSTAFMLAMTLSMLATPWLLLRFGLRDTYAGAVLLLLVGGVVGGFSINYPMLISMRVMEGLAAGILQPIPAIYILRVFDRSEHGRAMGIFGFGVVLAPAIGPSVGGFLVEEFGWRSIFFVVVPFCLLALFLVRKLLPKISTMAGDAQTLDWRGLLLASIGVVMLLNGMVSLQKDTWTGVALLLAGLMTLALFIWHQMRTPHPLVAMRVFRYRQFSTATCVAFIYGIALFGSTYMLPVYTQMALNYSPSHAGLVILPAGIVLALVMPLAGKMVDYYAPYLLVALGIALIGLSFVLMSTGKPGTGYVALMVWAIIGRIGLGFVLPALSVGSMRGVDPTLIAHGTSTINFVRQLGGAIGVSMVGIVLEWRLAAHHTALGDAGGNPADRIKAFDETFLLLAAICAIAVLLAWRMRPAPEPE